ncbi:MAG: protein translocase subunit SecDF [Bacteroidia bacterium]|jgi:SecD/SecF fusion protein|nr:protein translocase subunit SecDF [Bacteroidia bacterium]MBP7244465.1 protein translocase subunit SecDF [Bacteroidia bacterium]
MQSKGAIKLFAIVLALVCLYQLSFTLVTRGVEADAREYANNDPIREKEYLDSIGPKGVYNIGVKDYTYRECKEREINLGLDLKGGMNVTMEVSVMDLVRSMAGQNSEDPTFKKAIDRAGELQRNSNKDFVTLFGQAFTEVDPNASLAAVFANIENQDKIKFNSTNEQVLKVLKEESDAAISRSFNILRTRIDKFGVSQPNIQQLGSGRILVELPGVKEPDRVRKLLQGTAKLEFWETYTFGEVAPGLVAVNTMLANENKKDSLLGSLTSVNDSNSTTSTTSGDTTLASTPAQDTTKVSLVDKMGKDSTAAKDTAGGKTFEEFARENPLFAVLFPSDGQVRTQEEKNIVDKQCVIGYSLIKDTAKVNRILERDDVKAALPKNLRLLWTVKPRSAETQSLELIGIKSAGRDGKAPLDGAAISDARQDFGQFNSKPEISMRMNPDGAKVWKRLTGENVGKSIAIVLDDYVYSFPNVQGEIAGGSSSITGNFEINEAKDLANILKAGKLPAPARIVEEAVVGPSLGAEAIQNGLLSFLVALGIVFFFMAFYYSKAGIVADITLICNMFFIMGVLASLGAVLTLPGIAGIVLIIALSVDANILIFERIREELRLGKGLRLAISDGYKHAFSSIIDSNVTTLLLGIILYSFGSGPVQGFATTLIIGILCSLFSAIFISRLMFEYLLDKNKEIPFWTNATKDPYKNINLPFVENRKKYYIISGIVIAAGIFSIGMKGFNFGVDFDGGRTFVVQFDKATSTQEIRESLAAPFGEAPDVKTFGTDNRYKITTDYLIEENTAEAQASVTKALYEGLKGQFSGIDQTKFQETKIINSQKVGPTVADDIKSSALFSIFFGCALMFLYILVRFKKWQYGLGATLALLHDVMLILSIFSIFNGILPFTLEINQDFIAALLTVMGYSMTDTVVVFDRIREYLGIHPNTDKKVVINNALNSTLSRTMNTSLATFFVLLAIFIFGGDVIRGFIFALLIGIVVGTYSSLCIASPIVIDFDKNEKK